MKKEKRYGRKNINREIKIQDRIWDYKLRYLQDICSEYGNVRIKK